MSHVGGLSSLRPLCVALLGVRGLAFTSYVGGLSSLRPLCVALLGVRGLERWRTGIDDSRRLGLRDSWRRLDAQQLTDRRLSRWGPRPATSAFAVKEAQW
ncbi:MAG: hypothetical protein WBG76_12040, partial [Ornithinimicrobium sp.]